MGITESLLGKKNVDGNPYIEAIDPPAHFPEARSVSWDALLSLRSWRGRK